MPKKKTIVQEHNVNFETLKRAFLDGNVCLMDCVEKSSGEHVAVICATQEEANGETCMVPFARFFNGNPYEMLIPPTDPEFPQD